MLFKKRKLLKELALINEMSSYRPDIIRSIKIQNDFSYDFEKTKELIILVVNSVSKFLRLVIKLDLILNFQKLEKSTEGDSETRTIKLGTFQRHTYPERSLTLYISRWVNVPQLVNTIIHELCHAYQSENLSESWLMSRGSMNRYEFMELVASKKEKLLALSYRESDLAIETDAKVFGESFGPYVLKSIPVDLLLASIDEISKISEFAAIDAFFVKIKRKFRLNGKKFLVSKILDFESDFKTQNELFELRGEEISRTVMANSIKIK